MPQSRRHKTRDRLDGKVPPERNGKTEKRCLQATLRIRPEDCVTEQSYEAREDPTSDLFAKILSQNGNGHQHNININSNMNITINISTNININININTNINIDTNINTTATST